jgi:hypothetical protein
MERRIYGHVSRTTVTRWAMGGFSGTFPLGFRQFSVLPGSHYGPRDRDRVYLTNPTPTGWEIMMDFMTCAPTLGHAG